MFRDILFSARARGERRAGETGEFMLHYEMLANKSLRKTCLCSLLAFMLVLELLPLIVTAQTALIAVEPANYVAALNESFQVNITITDVKNLTSWQFGLYFRNNVLNCIGVTEGPFLSSVGPTSFFVIQTNNAYNSTHGRVVAACVFLGSVDQVSGSGLLAQVSFQAVGLGSTIIPFTLTQLLDEKIPPQPISHTQSDGAVQVKVPPLVFVSPANLSGLPNWIPINGTFTINVTIAMVTDLNYWQAGMSFNPAVLECINYTEGPFLKSAGSTVWQPGSIDNNIGQITPYGGSLGSGVGKSENGTLAYIVFRVKGTGSSSLVLQNVLLLDTSYSEIVPASIKQGYFDLPPEVPQPPTAFFTFSPISPYASDTVTFDASASSPSGGVIVSYEWDFGDTTQAQGIIANHTYPTAGGYNVSLVVVDDKNMTGSFFQLVTVVALPVGASVDVYTQRGGRGLNQPSDTFAPDELVIMTAYLTYNLAPVPDILVTFYVYFPNGTLMFRSVSTTHAQGLAFITYRLISPVFGIYKLNATASIADQTVSDSADCRIDWLAQVMSTVPCDRHGVPKNEFDKGEPLYLIVTLKNNRFNSTSVTVGTYVEDSEHAYLLFGSGVYYIAPNLTVIILSVGELPKYALIGVAAAHTSLAQWLYGRPLCPEVSSSFWISWPLPDVAVLDVNASPMNTRIGDSVEITITLFNEYYDGQDCSVNVYCNSTLIEKIDVLALSPYLETNFICLWDTYTYGEGNYVIRAVVPAVPRELDLTDNTFTLDGTVHIGPHVPVDDISVTGLASSKCVVGKGCTTNVTVTVQNQGDYSETFNVTVFVNEIPIVSFQGIVLSNGSSTTFVYTWDTSWSGYGNCFLKANATIVPNETDTADNTRLGGIIRVSVPGDVSGPVMGVPDGVVNMRDINYMILLFNSRPSSPNWNPNADVNSDGTVNMRDIQIAILNFNKHV
jgi:hypothetical protein